MAKVMVSVPDEVLTEIDRLARETGRSRSGLLQHVWRLYIANELSRVAPGDRPGVRDALTKAQAQYAQGRRSDSRDSTQIIRDMRDSRGGPKR